MISIGTFTLNLRLVTCVPRIYPITIVEMGYSRSFDEPKFTLASKLLLGSLPVLIHYISNSLQQPAAKYENTTMS